MKGDIVPAASRAPVEFLDLTSQDFRDYTLMVFSTESAELQEAGGRIAAIAEGQIQQDQLFNETIDFIPEDRRAQFSRRHEQGRQNVIHGALGLTQFVVNKFASSVSQDNNLSSSQTVLIEELEDELSSLPTTPVNKETAVAAATSVKKKAEALMSSGLKKALIIAVCAVLVLGAAGVAAWTGPSVFKYVRKMATTVSAAR